MSLFRNIEFSPSSDGPMQDIARIAAMSTPELEAVIRSTSPSGRFGHFIVLASAELRRRGTDGEQR